MSIRPDIADKFAHAIYLRTDRPFAFRSNIEAAISAGG
jgi:hypothetical protein